MSDSFYLGAYWGARRETVEECTDRWVDFLERIASIDSSLATWYERGRSDRDALRRPIDGTRERMHGLLLAGRNRLDSGDRAVIEELGFQVGMWNGAANAAGLTVCCGVYSEVKGVGNLLVMDLPSADGDAGRLFTRATARALVEAVVECWEPTWVTWTSDDLADAQPRGVGTVGWMTYLADPLVRRLEAPLDGYDTEQLDSGVLVTLADDATVVSADDVHRLRAALGDVVRWRDQD